MTEGYKLRVQSLFGGDDAMVESKSSSGKGKSGKGIVISCAKCTLNGKVQVIEPVNGNAKVLIVGEAPGEDEEKQGRIFVGRSGQLFRDCLAKAGWNMRDIQFTNTCRCRPTDEQGNNRTPTSKEMEICKKLYLDKDFERFTDILVAGKVPETATLGDAISYARGNVVIEKGKRIAVTYHPAYILRNRREDSRIENSFIRDLQFFKEVFIDGYKPSFILVDDEPKRLKCLDEVMRSTYIIFDVETTGLDRDCQLTMVGIGCPEGVYVIPTIGKYSENLSFVKRLFQFKDKEYIAHNAQFDYKILRWNDLCARDIKLKCTMTSAYLIEGKGGEESYKLKSICVKRDLRWSHLLLNPTLTDNLDDIFIYNAEDIINTRGLYLIQKELLEQKKLSYVDTQVLSPAINVISEMEGNGIRIDLESMKTVRVKLANQIDILRTELTDKFGERNWTSTTQLQEIFEQLAKGIATKKTSTGKLSTDEESIRGYLEYFIANPNTPNKASMLFLCESLLQLRESSKMLSTYVDGLSKRVGSDGRLRGHFWFIGTETGRLSSSGPNLQNIPRDGRIKVMFVTEPGWTLIESDLSQIELRVAASIANEPVMIRAYNEGIDLHSVTASAVSGVPLDKVTKVMRNKAKAVNFGFLYGQSWQGFKAYAKNKFGVILSDEEAQNFREAFFGKYVALRSWHERVDFECRSGLENITTVFGRIRRLDMSEDVGHRVRQALNTPVQGPASDCNLLAMRYVWDHVDPNKVRFLLTVHDQFMLEARDEYAEDVLGIIGEVTSYMAKKCSWLKVPFILDTKTGHNWCDMKEVKKK